MDYLTTHISLSPLRRGFAPGSVNYKKGALDSQPQVIKFISCLLMVGGSPASSNTKTDRHDIAEILLKVALNTINQSINPSEKRFSVFAYKLLRAVYHRHSEIAVIYTFNWGI